MSAWRWFLGGGAVAAVAAYYWTRQRDAVVADVRSDAAADGRSDVRPTSQDGASAPASPRDPLPGRWVWPLGVWGGRKPEISDGYRSKRRAQSGQLIEHGGVDLMYRRRSEDPWRAGTPNGTPSFVMPDHRAALAASDGVVSFAASTPRGGSVIVDHAPRKLATYYTHLSSLLVAAPQKVSAGTPIGVIGADPLDGQHLMHLHFETWRGGASDRFDPQPLMLASWEYLPDPGDRPLLVARNAGMPSARSPARRAGERPHHGTHRSHPFAERSAFDV